MIYKLKELDAIRGIAIILIVFYHMNYFIKPWPDWSIYGAVIGVGLFFFVSGYVLYLAHPKRITDLKTFCKKRLMRIYPLFTVAFILTFVQEPGSLNQPLKEIIGYYLNINNILEPRYMFGLNGYWFIGAILLYYI
jgi:peptidoglycan/LPS O-acetylase OafA/YrhL